MGRDLLRVGLIGCGIISEYHIRAYQQHAGRARIIVCCDPVSERAAQRAALAGGAAAVTDPAQVLADPRIDAVDICTPHHLHSDAVIAAARAGKHVLCQKPLARSLADCDAMIAAARDAGTVLFYGESNRTSPASVEARRLIDIGRIGRLVGIQASSCHWQGGEYMATAWRYDPAIAGGGALLDSGIHAIDHMLHIGGPIAAVSCTATRFRPELGGEDTSALIARYEAGHVGTLLTSQASAMWSPAGSFIAFGTEGALVLGGRDAALVLYRRDLPDNRELVVPRRGDGFAIMIGRYLDTVLDGAPNPSPGEVGRQNLAVVLAAYESARLRREVNIPQIDPSPART